MRTSRLSKIWRTGYAFALFVLMIAGTLFIIIGTQLFSNGSLENVIFISLGTTMGPAAFIGLLFRIFLFDEIQYELTRPVIETVTKDLGPNIVTQVNGIVKEYQKEIAEYQAEITLLKDLKSAGTLHPYRRRAEALKAFSAAIDSEESEIMIIGSSIKGLILLGKYKEFSQKLEFKMKQAGVTIRFLLTHPVVADLRANQESRKWGDIGAEIIQSLRSLERWGVPCENVRLYKGTPTCFAIKTSHAMLLNPYPYGSVAYDSPCWIVTTDSKNPSYFYDAFDAYHFGTWDSTVAERIDNYAETIDRLQNNLDDYSALVQQILK